LAPPAILEIYTEVIEPGWHFSLLVRSEQLSVVAFDDQGIQHVAFSKSLDAIELAALKKILEAEAIRWLNPSYVKPNTIDGSASHVFIRSPGRPPVETFVQNQVVPALSPLSSFLRVRLPPDLQIVVP
jgi:hypothetical protein